MAQQARVRYGGVAGRQAVARDTLVILSGALLVEIVVAVGLQASGNLSHDGTVGAVFGTPAWVGRVFLVDHLLAFEITSVVLLIAAVGGVILGSHTRRAT